MNIELKQAAQRALLALRNSQPHPSNPFIGLTDNDFIDHEETIRQLRNAIQQAEAQQPATGEPVAWMASYVDPVGNERVYVTSHHNLAVENDKHGKPRPLVFGDTHPAPSVLKDDQIAALVNKVRDIARMFHDHQSLRERIAIELVPALKVSQEVKSNAERYRWLRDNWFTMGASYPEDTVKFHLGNARWSEQPESNLDAAIDAAMLEAK